MKTVVSVEVSKVNTGYALVTIGGTTAIFDTANVMVAQCEYCDADDVAITFQRLPRRVRKQYLSLDALVVMAEHRKFNHDCDPLRTPFHDYNELVLKDGKYVEDAWYLSSRMAFYGHDPARLP